jgi:hypothetical protein
MKSEKRKFRMLLLFAVVFTTLAFVSVGGASRTPPEEAWNKAVGGTEWDDGANHVQQTADGGYILAGYTRSYIAGDRNFWLVKTDSEGTKQWDRTFGRTEWDEANYVQQTSDGGYILAGYTRSYGAGSWDFWLVKTDSEGIKQWDRIFGATEFNYAYAVQQTSDDGYILAGWTKSYSAGDVDFWLVKTDSRGTTQWDQTFRGTDSDMAKCVQQTSDGGYILVGETRSYGAGNADFWLVKTDSEGNKEWDKTFGGGDQDSAHYVQQTSDGGYVLAGSTRNVDFWLVKTDSEGNKEWDKTFGGANADHVYSVQQTSDDSYILAGCTKSYSAGEYDAYDVWLIKVGGTSILSETIAPTANICVESDPSGADVYLDGVYQGVTGPGYFHIYNVSSGYHTLTLKKYGYDDYTKTIIISTGDRASVSLVSASLSAIPAPTPEETRPPEQKNKTTQTIKIVGGIIFLAAAALLAGMLVGKFHKKRREEPKRDERKHETHKKSAGSTKDDTRPHYYKVLDVSTDASRDEIKKAYRRLSMLYHPDASTDPDAEKKMKEINKAHDVLSDPDKRARYDNFENAFKG